MIGHSQSLGSDHIHLTPNCLFFVLRRHPAPENGLCGTLFTKCPCSIGLSSQENRPKTLPYSQAWSWMDQLENKGAQAGSCEPREGAWAKGRVLDGQGPG